MAELVLNGCWSCLSDWLPTDCIGLIPFRSLFDLQITTGLGFCALLQNSLFDSASLGKSHLRVVAGTNNKEVGQPGSKAVALGVLDGNNVERVEMVLNVHELSDTTRVTSLGDKDHGAKLKLEIG